jgi:hypothetical protein
MALQKMGNFTFNHVNQTDELGLTADEAKEKFDSRGEELKTALNNAVDALNATADGNSGADNVGATPVEGWPGSSVQAIMESAKSDIAGHKAVAAVQAHLAKNIAIEDTGGLFTATHVEGALGELFTSVSNGKSLVAASITDKGVPTSGSDSFSQMADNIDSIVLGSGNAVEADVLSGKTFSNDSGTGKVGTMPNRGAVSQSLAVNGSYTIPQGYHNGAGQVTQSIATKGAATITPSTVNQVIAAGQYLTGAQTIAGSANLLAANIKEGVNIFGVVGTLAIGKRWASGTAVRSGSLYTFQVSGLAFTPRIVITKLSNASDDQTGISIYVDSAIFGTSYGINVWTYNGTNAETADAQISAGGFTIKAGTKSVSSLTCNWVAFE